MHNRVVGDKSRARRQGRLWKGRSANGTLRWCRGSGPQKWQEDLQFMMTEPGAYVSSVLTNVKTGVKKDPGVLPCIWLVY
jgi:hypothetical protein